MSFLFFAVIIYSSVIKIVSSNIRIAPQIPKNTIYSKIKLWGYGRIEYVGKAVGPIPV
jgi:hypothetical protein